MLQCYRGLPVTQARSIGSLRFPILCSLVCRFRCLRSRGCCAARRCERKCVRYSALTSLSAHFPGLLETPGTASYVTVPLRHHDQSIRSDRVVWSVLARCCMPAALIFGGVVSPATPRVSTGITSHQSTAPSQEIGPKQGKGSWPATLARRSHETQPPPPLSSTGHLHSARTHSTQRLLLLLPLLLRLSLLPSRALSPYLSSTLPCVKVPCFFSTLPFPAFLFLSRLSFNNPSLPLYPLCVWFEFASTLCALAPTSLSTLKKHQQHTALSCYAPNIDTSTFCRYHRRAECI